MSDKSGIAQVDKPVQVAWRNRRVKTRENNDGIFFLAEFEFDEETWGFLKTIPRNANGEMVIWVTEVGMVTEKPPKKEKEKAPFGALWQQLLHRNMGFEHTPGVKEALEEARESAYETPHALMRKLFGVESLSRLIGPDEICAKFPPDQFPAVQIMVEQAGRKVGG